MAFRPMTPEERAALEAMVSALSIRRDDFGRVIVTIAQPFEADCQAILFAERDPIPDAVVQG